MAYRLRAIGKIFAAVVFAFGLLETQAEAIAVLTFDQSVDGGTVSYGGGAAAAVGASVAFDILVATDTAANAGSYGCSGCVLNFTTGANTSNVPAGGGLRTYSWAAGGSFVLSGTVFDPVTLVVIASGDLLTGSFIAAQATSQNLSGAGRDIINFTGQGTDFKHPDLLAFFGLANDPFNFSNFEGSGSGTVGAGGSFSGTVNEADLINTEEVEQTPEPASALLIALGLLSIGAAVRRRRS